MRRERVVVVLLLGGQVIERQLGPRLVEFGLRNGLVDRVKLGGRRIDARLRLRDIRLQGVLHDLVVIIADPDRREWRDVVGRISFSDEEGIDLAAILETIRRRAVGDRRVEAGAPPRPVVILADALGDGDLRAAIADGAGAVDGGVDLQVHADLGEIPLAEAMLAGVLQIRQHGRGVDRARDCPLDIIDPGDLAEQRVEVGNIHHVRDDAVRSLHQRPGDDQRDPDAGLIRSALGARSIERQLNGLSEAAIVAKHDHHRASGHHQIGALWPIDHATVLAALRETGLHQQPTQLSVERLDHQIRQNPLRLPVGAVQIAARHIA